MTGPWIAIAVGDVTGVGPEVTLKALAAEPADDPSRYLILGDVRVLNDWNRRLRLGLKLQPFARHSDPGRFFVHAADVPPLPPRLGPGAPEAALAAVRWLREGAARCLRGLVAALVTAPVSKEAIIRAGHPRFVGQTEFLSELAGTPETTMMLLGADERARWLRVALATHHVRLRDVARRLREENVLRAIRHAAGACADLELPRARVAVCGLNPHAGEGGKLGDEEGRLIAPAILRARALGLEVSGPFAADALFYHVYHGEYDAVVAMYHDQGLTPLKMIGFERGVNWTLGLPFVRTSPDHGTAYDIAGRGVARASSMQAALALAQRLARRGAAAG